MVAWLWYRESDSYLCCHDCPAVVHCVAQVGAYPAIQWGHHGGDMWQGRHHGVALEVGGSCVVLVWLSACRKGV
jgi:hypothetical protein